MKFEIACADPSIEQRRQGMTKLQCSNHLSYSLRKGRRDSNPDHSFIRRCSSIGIRRKFKMATSGAESAFPITRSEVIFSQRHNGDQMYSPPAFAIRFECFGSGDKIGEKLSPPLEERGGCYPACQSALLMYSHQHSPEFLFKDQCKRPTRIAET
jgi:hypothetical protein